MVNLKKLNNEDLIIYTCMCYDEYEHGNKKNFEANKARVKKFIAARDELIKRMK